MYDLKEKDGLVGVDLPKTPTDGSEINAYGLTWIQQAKADSLARVFCLGCDCYPNGDDRASFCRHIMNIADDNGIPYAAIDPNLQLMNDNMSDKNVDGAAVMEATKGMF
jgi:hypothetical protein